MSLKYYLHSNALALALVFTPNLVLAQTQKTSTKPSIDKESLLYLKKAESNIRRAQNHHIKRVSPPDTLEKNSFPAYKAHIKRNTVIYSLDMKESWRAKREAIVYANEIIKGGERAYIYNKKQVPVYIVFSKDLTKVEDVVDLDLKVDTNKSWKRKDFEHNSFDTHLQLEHTLSFHLENIRAVYFSDIFEQESTGGRANRLEWKSYLPLGLPVHFGLATSYQDGRWNNFEGGSELAWNAAYLGPRIRTNLFRADNWRFNTEIGLDKSLFFDVEKSFQLSSNTWLAMSELEIDFAKNTYVFTLGYRLLRGHIKKSSIGTIEQSSDRREITSINFSFGYRFDQWL